MPIVSSDIAATVVPSDAAATVVPSGVRRSTRPPLTRSTVEQIVALEDPSLRNLWITESYADLAGRLLTVFGSDQSWCTFATWASNTAGLSIRGDELPHIVHVVLPQVAPHVSSIVDEANATTSVLRSIGLTRLLEVVGVESLVGTALRQVSDFIAHGNTLVYAELAPLFVGFVEWLESSDGTDDLDGALRRVGVPEADDEPLVHLAFRSYALAARCSADADRAQLVLTANIAAVLHEQQRLQHDVVSALDAGLLDLEDELGGLCHRMVPGPIRRAVGQRAHDGVAPHVAALWEHVATHVMMTLAVPGETLHLGRDLPPLPDGSWFPESLRHVDHPDLAELLAAWDPTSGTTVGSGADDWADLHQRMGFIVNLFRSRQRRVSLTTSPFDDAQFAAMQYQLSMADGLTW